MTLFWNKYGRPNRTVSFFYTLILLLAAPYALAIVSAGGWEAATGVTVATGPRLYDTSARLNYTVNTVTNASGATLNGPIRLLVTASNYPVANAEGTDDNGQPYFTVLADGASLASGASRSVRINFTPTRVTLNYSVSVVAQTIVADADGDGIPDATDSCPTDPGNDEDNDGICAMVDSCPNDWGTDDDEDGLCGSADACPYDQGDQDGDGICYGDDSCPYEYGTDDDNDGICGEADTCPYDWGDDWDGDGICGEADTCPDDPGSDEDDDGYCGLADTCPNDPGIDEDNDGICGIADTCPYDWGLDDDEDGVCGMEESCPSDPSNDEDNDGYCGMEDNCPTVANEDQRDSDDDGLGDACDNSLVLEGTLYGTDGQPMPGARINSDTCAGSFQTLTDASGLYRFETSDLSWCEGGQGFYADGNMTVIYVHEGVAWTRSENFALYDNAALESDWDSDALSDARPMAMALTSVSTTPVDQNRCVQDGLVARCRHDVRLPTVWGPLSGTIYQSASNFALFIGSQPNYPRNAVDSAAVGLGAVSDEGTAYGPIAIPVASNTSATLYDYASDTTFGETSFPMPAATGWIQDLGEFASAPVRVTLFKEYERLEPYTTVTLGSSTGYTDANGVATLDGVSMGAVSSEIHVWKGNYWYRGAGYGYVTVNDQMVELDFNGYHRNCTVSGIAYDSAGQPMAAGQTLQGRWASFIVEGSFQTQTEEGGHFTITNVGPGLFQFRSSDNETNNYRYNIDNCRTSREIEMDLPYADHYLPQASNEDDD